MQETEKESSKLQEPEVGPGTLKGKAQEQYREADLSVSGDKPRAWRTKLADRAARVVITAGGVGIILSLAAIFLVIAAETGPLWRSPSANQENTFALSEVTNARRLGSDSQAVSSLALGVDEYQEIAYLVTRAGTVDFLSLKNGQLLQRYEIKGLEGQAPTAAYHDPLRRLVALGTAQGRVVPLIIGFAVNFQGDARVLKPEVAEGRVIELDPQGRTIKNLVYQEEEGKIAAAALFSSRSLVFYAARAQHSLLGPGKLKEYRTDLSTALKSDVSALALDGLQVNLLAGTTSGEIYHWEILDPQDPHFVATYKHEAGIKVLGWLLGERSLVIGDSTGGVSTWFQVRDPEKPEERLYQRIHILDSHRAAVTAIAPSPRDKGFLTADEAGMVLLHHATSEQTFLELSSSNAIETLSFAPKANGILAVNTEGNLSHWSLHNPHPETTLKTLLGKVWYEGYEKPEYVWQSSSATDDFEPKFSLTPLVYGTLKGTFYALLLAIPISICAAVYTSQFMHPSLRNLVKPAVEVMAALPSVVLGFFAGLWLAPIIERMIPATFLLLLVLPLVALGASLLWRLLPSSWRNRLKPGTELAFLCPILVLAVWFCINLNGPVEAALFNGNFPQWLYDTFGLRYDPRNSLVVGLAMGFAVIPLIYTISEDALSNVPQHLISGSLGLGGDPLANGYTGGSAYSQPRSFLCGNDRVWPCGWRNHDCAYGYRQYSSHGFQYL